MNDNIGHERAGADRSTRSERATQEKLAALVAVWIEGPPDYALGSAAGGSSTELANERRWKADLRRDALALHGPHLTRNAARLLDMIEADTRPTA